MEPKRAVGVLPLGFIEVGASVIVACSRLACLAQRRGAGRTLENKRFRPRRMALAVTKPRPASELTIVSSPSFAPEHFGGSQWCQGQ